MKNKIIITIVFICVFVLVFLNIFIANRNVNSLEQEIKKNNNKIYEYRNISDTIAFKPFF